MKNQLGLSNEEQENIKMICEYLLFDQYTEVATYLRFERCFQPLFSDEDNLDLEHIFKELCGPKKKYLNYKRFVSSYLKYKENKVSKELNTFFDKLFNSILQNDKTIGSFEEGRLTFSTRRANKNRECITLIEVLNDKEGVIHGINLLFDNVFKNKLYPKSIEENLSVGLEISLKILDEEKLEKRGITKYIKASYFRDAVTHVFGTVDKETGFITFLGFKCVSGKTQFVGFPKGKSFLIGEFGKKMQQLKCQMTTDGITTLLIYFEKNYRPNHYLTKKISKLTLKDLSKDEIILDEEYLAKIKDKNEIDKFITTPLIDDAHFFNFRLKDNIFGNSLKEVIIKKPKKWMILQRKAQPMLQRNISLRQFILKFEEEQRRRGRFFREQGFAYPGYNPRLALLNRNRRHRRRRLRPMMGFGYERFPFVPFGGKFPPFGPNPRSIRSLSVPQFPPHGPAFIPPPNHGFGPFGNSYMRPPPFHDQYLNSPIFTHFGPPHHSPSPHMHNYRDDYNYQRRLDEYDNYMRQQNIYVDNMLIPTRENKKYNQQQDFNNVVLRARPKQINEEKNINESNYITHINNSCRPIKKENDNQLELEPNEQKIIEPKIEEKGGDKKKENGEYLVEDEDDDDEEILIPDEHPEETTSLEELDQQLTSIKKLLENKKLKEEDRNKLLKLEKLYTQQKNILLDNVEEKEKEELLKKTDINIEEYIKKEEEKRKEVENDEDKLIENELEKNADKKDAETISIVSKPDPKKIFRNQDIYRGKEPWTDPLFKPCKENLCPCNESGWLLPENVLFTDVDGWEKYNWNRVEDILNSKNYQVFEEGITPDDIIQGSIGDCYFLSAIGSLCKFSRYIDKLFFTKEKTKEHLYGVFIYLNACWKLVLIDDFLPYTGKRFKKFAFSASGGKELWVAFLEKAWAKINGSYAKIGCGGSPTEVFDVLTEAYSEQVSIHPYYKDYIWETMFDSEKKGYIMTAGTSSDIYNLNLDGVGLSAGHAYTVLGVMEIKTANGVEKVVRLRNPYGNGEFNGDWSDYSKKWTPELTKQYKLVIKDDGDFYMSFDDFLNYYVTLGICKLHPGYKTTSLNLVDPEKCQVTKITVSKGEVHAFLQLYQKNPRIQLKDGTYQKLVYCFLLLVDKDFNYIYSVQGGNMHIGIEQNLKEGTYYLLTDVNYRYANPDKKKHNYVVTCYAQTPLNLENATNNIDVTKAIQTAIYSYCRQYVPPNTCSNGVFLYRISTNMDSLPFEAAVFENYTDKNYRVKVNVSGRGDKSFCFYHDEIVSENETSAIKELHINSVAVFAVLKYSLSSVFSLKYFFASLKTPNPESPTAQKAPKIYPEKSTLKPEQPNNQVNEQFATQNQDMQNNPQYDPSQVQAYQDNTQYDPSQVQVYQDNTQYNPSQVQAYQDNSQYNPSQVQDYQDNTQYNPSQVQYYQNTEKNTPQDIRNQINPSQNMNIGYNQQCLPSQYQNMKFNQQYAPSQMQFIGNNVQYINQQNIQNNSQYIQNKNQFLNQNSNYEFSPKPHMKKISKTTQKINVKRYTKNIPQYSPQKNKIKNNIAYMPLNKNIKMNINFSPYSQNIQKINNIKIQTVKKAGNPVFQTQGQIIDEGGALVQYAMIKGVNYIIGLENRSNMKVRLQLLLKGLMISSTGKNYAIFYSNPKERKIFTTKLLPNFNYEQIGFEFQYA